MYEVFFRCFVVVSIVFIWDVFFVIYDDLNNESILILDLFVDFVCIFKIFVMVDVLWLVDLFIKERRFLFGYIKFKFIVSFIGKDWDLLEFFGIDSVWIEVKCFEMIVVIRGMRRKNSLYFNFKFIYFVVI